MILQKADYNKQKNKPIIINFKGYNGNSVIEEGEFTDMQNLSSRNYPCISPRIPRKVSRELVTGDPRLFAGSVLCYVLGQKFFYNHIEKGALAYSAYYTTMVEYSGKILIFPHKKVYDIATDTFGDLGSGTYPTAGSVPDIDFACVYENRVWGVEGNNIYASKLGDCTDWTTFAGVATDAYATTVASVGDFLGIVAYANHVVFFKKSHTYELYNKTPETFRVLEVEKDGCIDNRSIVEINGVLYYYSKNGFKAYSGGVSRNIDYKLNQTVFTSVKACGDGRRYYASAKKYLAPLTYSDTLYVYDTLLDMWHIEDTLPYGDLCFYNGKRYATWSGLLYNNTHIFYSTYTHSYLSSRTQEVLTTQGLGTSVNYLYEYDASYTTYEQVAWSATSEIFTEIVNDRKGYSQISARIDLGEVVTEGGSVPSDIQFFIKENNGDFVQASPLYTATGLRTIQVNIKPNEVDHFQIKIIGNGNAKVYNLVREFFYSE